AASSSSKIGSVRSRDMAASFLPPFVSVPVSYVKGIIGLLFLGAFPVSEMLSGPRPRPASPTPESRGWAGTSHVLGQPGGLARRASHGFLSRAQKRRGWSAGACPRVRLRRSPGADHDGNRMSANTLGPTSVQCRCGARQVLCSTAARKSVCRIAALHPHPDRL